MTNAYARIFWALVMGLLFAATLPLALVGAVSWGRRGSSGKVWA